MKFIDLFAGIGGFRYGMDVAVATWNQQRLLEESKNNASVDIGKMGTQQFDCVYSNEWDKYANSVYRRHYEKCDDHDIREVDARRLPQFDLLAGGFPCQSFSIAGRRRGFADTRGTLFFEIARIAKEKQPRLLLLENVKGLLSHEQGETFRVILASLDELGYDCQWQVLNSKDFGVPQNRERVFIIGHLRGTPRPKVFPLTQFGMDEKSAAVTLTARGYGSQRNGTYVAKNTKTRSDKQSIQQEGNRSNRSNSIRRASYTNDIRIRRLTPVECERLQGFPDDWTKYGADGEIISDTQRYKMCGNAVTTNVITEIIKNLTTLH